MPLRSFSTSALLSRTRWIRSSSLVIRFLRAAALAASRRGEDIFGRFVRLERGFWFKKLSRYLDRDVVDKLVAGDLVVREDLEVFFNTRPKRVVLVGSDGMVVRQEDRLEAY